MSDIPLLALWRHRPAATLRRQPELPQNLKSFLLERTKPASNDERRLIDAALNDQAGYALLELARNVPDPKSDYAMSFILVAALLNLELAVVILIQELVTRAMNLDWQVWQRGSFDDSDESTDQTFRLASRRLLSLALSWTPHVRTSFFFEPQSWHKELGRLGDSSPPTFEELSGDSASSKYKALLAKQLTLTVVPTIGDARSADGEIIARLYGALTKPLPMKGGDVDPNVIAAALALEFPHLADAIAPVVHDLRLRRQAGVLSAYIRPLLLIGPPGAGKTRFAHKLARFLGLGYGEISGAGSSDDRMLRGTARGYRNCQPALPLLIMLQSGSANPIIIVDDLDKAGGSSRNGDIRHTLTSLLERDTAASWFDECLLAPCDLSQVSWICTANDVAGLPGPLLNRLRVIRCPRPKPEMFDHLLESVLHDIARALGIERALLPPLDGAIVEKIHQAFARRGDVRALKRLIETALGAVVSDPRQTH